MRRAGCVWQWVIAGIACSSLGCGLYDNPWEPPDESGGETGADPDKTFFIAEVTTYETAPDPCKTSNVATVTEDFKLTLQLDGWTGTRRVSSQTRPSDFYDQGFIPFGKDHLYSDSKRVAVFAGHGHVGLHSFRLMDPERPNVCVSETAAYMGGQGQGSEQSLFISVSSCGGPFNPNSEHPNEIAACFKDKWLLSQFRQWLGFADSPVVDPYALTTFYDSLSSDPANTNGQSDVWIDVMEFPEAGAPTMPIVYTKQTLAESQGFDGETVHYEMNMRSGRHMNNNPANKQYHVVTPVYPMEGFPNACMNGIFSC